MVCDRTYAVPVRIAFHIHGIEIRIVYVPETRIVDMEHALFPAALRHLVAYAHFCPFNRHFRRGNVHTPGNDMIFRTHKQTAVAVQSAAGVPARRMGDVVATDRKRVFACTKVLRQIDPPTRVAVRPTSKELSVQVEHGIAHCSIALENDPSVLRHGHLSTLYLQCTSVNFQLEPVPSYSCDVKERIAVGSIGIERTVHAPVVRNAHIAPG